ncbi:hypothetical protein [Thiobacillus sp.]
MLGFMKKNRVSMLLLATIVILLACALTFWPRDTPDVGVSAPLPAAKEVRTVEKVRTEVKVVYVYPKAVKAKLDLPAPVVTDDAKQVIATGKLDAEERPYTLSAVLDTETGGSQVYARPDPLPWVGPGRRGAVGVAYGLKNGHAAGRMYAQHDLLQIKALHAGARGTVDTDGDWFAGGYVEFRF